MKNYIQKIIIKKSKNLFLKARKDLGYPFRRINFNHSVLVNSFPKSGTHLLVQIVESFPILTNYGFFIASSPSRPHKVRSESTQKKLISKIISGELVRGHLFFKKNYAQLLSDKEVIHFFIYRDLRDVIVSETLYLTYMNKWHHLHNYFAKQLSTDEERITASITGIKSTKFYYPDIRTRWENYSGWLKENQVFSVKYEDLISDRKEIHIREMIEFYKSESNLDFDVDLQLEKCLKAINPEKSHTFRKGGSGNWKNHFSKEHVDLVKDYVGDILIELKYEENLDW